MQFKKSLVGFWFIASVAVTAQAQILVGQTAGLTGPVAAGVKETLEGANLYLDSVNKNGGVNGQKIELLSLDDKFDPKLAAENARILIEDKQVVAMFLTRGTPHTEAVVPMLDKYGVPLIGPSTGALVLHTPIKKHVFNVRAGYQREAEKAIAHLAQIGITRVALVYADDSFGADAVAGAQKGLATAKLSASSIEKFDRTKPDFSGIAPKIAKTEPQAVMIFASGAAVVDCIKALKMSGIRAQFVTLSNNASNGFIKSLGENARGVVVTQVLPHSSNYAIVKEANDLAKANGTSEVSPAMLEGFSSAKVLVEALRRAGNKPSRERIQAALESFRKFDIGGLEISYGPDDHTGLDFADLSIISASGKFIR
jgi:branched-chain amino acid transport system substrate-binding protein